MPYDFERSKQKMPREFDRRVKLTDDERKRIPELYGQGMSIHQLAATFSVSRRTVQFILFPERLAKNRADRIANGGSMAYYDRERNTAYVREHRRYKSRVLKRLKEQKR